MSGKRARILGIIGGGLTLIINLISIASYIYTLMLPYGQAYPESKGLAEVLLPFNCISCLFAAVGFIGSLFVYKKPLLAAVLMIISGPVMIFLMLISVIGIGLWMADIMIFILLPIEIPPVLITVAAGLAFIYRDSVIRNKENLDS